MQVTDDVLSQIPACARLGLDAPAPSRLELQRQAAAYSAGLPALLDRAPAIALALDLDDDDRRAVAAVLPVLFDALTAIAGDDAGRAALAGIARIEIGAAPGGELRRQPADRLIVGAPRSPRDGFSFAALLAALEKLL
jgi:hypothetical protein